MKTKLLSAFFYFSCLSSFAQCIKLLDFTGANGNEPGGSLISDGTFLYGMTQVGGTSTNCGANGCGVLFKIKTDGTGYVKLLDFAGASNGGNPHGDLISDGTFLYGMTSQGGTNNLGVIFKIKSDGTGYTKLLDFTGTANGSHPWGSLISDGTFLYGMTQAGGISNSCGAGAGCGVLFKIKTDGTGYVKLLDFLSATNGGSPRGSLISDGTFLYGITTYGGTFADGVIFKIKPDGTGYVKLLDFVGTANGRSPYGSLISDGTSLYGMTYYGGTNDMGVIFKIKPDGTGYAKLLDFAGVANGSQPYSSFISDGIFLYGMTTQGDTTGDGLIFKIKPDGTGYSKLFDFSSTSGYDPFSSLVSDGAFLYGMTYSGGTNGVGTVFKLGGVLAISENSLQNDFSIFPNPSNGIFSVQSSENKISSIEIINVLGEKIYSANVKSDKTEINLSIQPKGVYFCKVILDNRGIAVKKIIIQ